MMALFLRNRSTDTKNSGTEDDSTNTAGSEIIKGMKNDRSAETNEPPRR